MIGNGDEVLMMEDDGGPNAAAAATIGEPATAAMRATGDAAEEEADADAQPFFAFDEPAALLLLDLDFTLDLDMDFAGVDPSFTDALIGEGGQLPIADASKSHGLQQSEPPHIECDATKSGPKRPLVAGDAATGADTTPQFTYRGRKNAKQELVYLREQMQALKQQLSSLQHPAAELSSSTLPPSSTGTSANAVVWEQIAQRQQLEKQNAEVENVKLRELLEGQQRVASSLDKFCTSAQMRRYVQQTLALKLPPMLCYCLL